MQIVTGYAEAGNALVTSDMNKLIFDPTDCSKSALLNVPFWLQGLLSIWCRL